MRIALLLFAFLASLLVTDAILGSLGRRLGLFSKSRSSSEAAAVAEVAPPVPIAASMPPDDTTTSSGAPSVTPRGITNLYNTCYLNSILQSLDALASFREGLLAASSTLTATQQDSSVDSELCYLLNRLHSPAASGEGSMEIKPVELARALDLDVTLQEDAEEMLLRLLNAISESKADGVKNATSLLMFQTLQRIRCLEHDHVNEKRVSNFDLSLDISQSQRLEDALDAYFDGELLIGEERYRCPQHGLQDAEKTLYMASFPQFLTIHLQRFSFDLQTSRLIKLGNRVEVPLTLNLTRYHFQAEEVAGTMSEEGIYDLTAVVVHDGGGQGGHYYTLRQSPVEENAHWWLCNDHNVQQVDWNEVQDVVHGIRRPLGDRSCAGYLLFYTRRLR
eukprot:gene6406-7061_t